MTVPVTFTLDELWLLRQYIRHESLDQQRWYAAPTEHLLNREICRAIVSCTRTGQKEWTLELDHRQLLAIDYCIPQDAKSPDGVPVGKSVLYKAMEADFRDETPAADEPDPELLFEKLALWREQDAS